MLKRLFILNTDDSQPWIKIILWWEYRRILYNFLLIVFGVFVFAILSFIIKDIWTFFSPPIFLLMLTGLFLFLANVLFTSGWVFQLLTRNSSNKFINLIRPKVFIYGLFFSFSLQLIPVLASGIYTIITGERIKSRYADFATTKPKFSDIVGEYKLADISKKRLNFPDSLTDKTIIRFNSDSTFTFQFFPDHTTSMTIDNYSIINVKGKWSIAEDFGTWAIPLTFEETETLGINHIEYTQSHYSNMLKINKDEPPYEIYIIVGDPDNWEGVTLQRR